MNIECQIAMDLSYEFPYILQESMTEEYNKEIITQHALLLVALQPSFALVSLGVISRGDNSIEATLAVLGK